MIDVGTGHGSTFEPFAERGWQVYGFEPDPENRQKALSLFPGTTTVKIDNRAVSNKIQKNQPFYRSSLSPGISGLSSFDESHKQDGTIETTTLRDFVREKSISRIDYLKVDTEGFDLFVLQGFPWDSLKPSVVMCEFEDEKTLALGYSYADLIKILKTNGYKVIVSEWHPVIKRGGPHKWKRFVNSDIDQPGLKNWGNMIAVLGDEQFKSLLDCASKSTLRWKIGNFIWKFWGLLSSHG